MKRLRELCEGSSVQWQKMVGIMFRSPLMDEEAQFWADDYEYGSFKNWLKKKYTGPYLSQCKEEGLYSSFYDVQDIGPQTEMYVGYTRIPKALELYRPGNNDKEDGGAEEAEKTEYTEHPYFAGWMKDGGPRLRDKSDRVEKLMFKDYPLDSLFWLFGSDPFQLLERLPLDSVLCPGFDRLPPTASVDSPDSAGSADPSNSAGEGDRDQDKAGETDAADDETQYFEENTCKTVTEELTFIDERIDAAFRANEDSPYNQVLPMPFATELIYRYDFGDNWKVRITASYNCLDMIEKGTIDQDTLDKANIKCRETYRPVLIARDGEMVMDDVGNLTGFVNFLRAINPELEKMGRAERVRARAEKNRILEWAKGQGWKRNDAANINLL